MIAVDRPSNLSIQSVLAECIDGIGKQGLPEKIIEIENTLISHCKLYEIKASHQELFEFSPTNLGDDEIITGRVTKGELKKLYTQYLVGETKKARRIYDSLINQQEICPTCGFGHVKALDHYLPKSKFPCFAILPFNLIPSCTDCNSKKSNDFATSKNKQPMHPYYDSHNFTTEQWLFAKVQEAVPVSVQYYVDPPDSWTDTDKERVQAHFKDFELSLRFSIQAGVELSTPAVPSYIKGDSLMIKRHLQEKFDQEFNLHKNSWKTALYYALINSDWYCNGGYE